MYAIAARVITVRTASVPDNPSIPSVAFVALIETTKRTAASMKNTTLFKTTGFPLIPRVTIAKGELKNEAVQRAEKRHEKIETALDIFVPGFG